MGYDTEGEKGQGTSTIYNGVTYSTAGGTIAADQSSARRSGNTSYSTTGDVTAGSGTRYGDGGGAVTGNSGVIVSGAGKQGAVFLSWIV